MLTLPVSIPLSSGVIVHQSAQPDIEKPLELKVKLPIEAYATAPCQDLAHLQSRLKTSNLLPPVWIDASNQQTPLVLFTFRCEPPLFHPKIFYTFHVDHELTWTLSVCKFITSLNPRPSKMEAWYLFQVFYYIVHAWY